MTEDAERLALRVSAASVSSESCLFTSWPCVLLRLLLGCMGSVFLDASSPSDTFSPSPELSLHF